MMNAADILARRVRRERLYLIRTALCGLLAVAEGVPDGEVSTALLAALDAAVRASRKRA